MNRRTPKKQVSLTSEHRNLQLVGSLWTELLVFASLMLMVFTVSADDATPAFLKHHWAFPIPSQGQPPKTYTPLEASLDPPACGNCHAKQYQDWRTSLHSHAMDAGVMGQLLAIKPNATEELRACTRCHAPLAEQETSLKNQLRGNKQANTLHHQGLVCAACHVRRHVRYGPPPLQTSTAEVKPHGGFVAAKAFQDGRFCATCHQFGADGYALNGKPLENTYAEWQASPYAAQGVQCQGCHMPERRHLWRGIHDAEMTRKGVTIDAKPPVSRDGRLSALLSISNSGTGHAFPTYVTPRVLMQIYQVATDGKVIEATLRQQIIAREVTADLSGELSDTRILPGARAILKYDAPRHPQARALVYRVRVEPDHFYTGLYLSLLKSQPQDKGTALIRTALKNSLDSHYDLYLRRDPLSP